MSVPASLLRTLHRIHQQLFELKHRLERVPKQVRIRQASVETLEASLTAARESCQQTKMQVDQKQLELKAGENKVEDLKAKLNACSSNKEFHALQEQIAAAEMAGSVLADEILEGLEKADQLEEAAATAKVAVETAKTQLAAFRDEMTVEAETIQRDLKRLQIELADAEQQLPADFKETYERVVRGKGADAMALAEDAVCNGCGQQITLNMQNQLLLSEPILCTACGRILYPPEP